ncbi:atherin-like [Camarhynchus parvulus]|uniref:atherin-like n=1 Tax=Geospiza parvula TaxID=87175 RepID=UPI001237D333|nr:atherin-like [Camarhynchus parvulus]
MAEHVPFHMTTAPLSSSPVRISTAQPHGGWAVPPPPPRPLSAPPPIAAARPAPPPRVAPGAAAAARPGPARPAARAPRRNLHSPWERRRVLPGRRGWAWWCKDGTGVQSSGACGGRQRAQRITPCGVVSEEAVSPGRKAKALGHHGVTLIGKLHFPTGMGKFGGDPKN